MLDSSSFFFKASCVSFAFLALSSIFFAFSAGSVNFGVFIFLSNSIILKLLFGKIGSVALATKGKKNIDKINPNKIFLLIFPPYCTDTKLDSTVSNNGKNSGKIVPSTVIRSFRPKVS